MKTLFQPYSEYQSRTMSLPQGTQGIGAGASSHRHSSAAALDRHGYSESSSEGDASASNKKEKKGSVFKFFNRRKGAQV